MAKKHTNQAAFILKFILLICIQQITTFTIAQSTTVKQLKIGKSGENVFASDYFDGKIFYCSDKKVKSKKGIVNEYNQNFLDLYSIEFNLINKVLGTEVNLGPNINSPLNEGPIDFNPTSGKGYFSSNRIDSVTTELFLTLFQTTMLNSELEKRVQLFKEEYNYNIAHPTISEDGLILVFSSDNENSKGQTDLFMSILDNDKWSNPVAISNINTEAVETFPHFNGNILYFSSDRPNGNGGLDIYRSQFKNDLFSDPEILDQPINSQYDDFLFIPINETEGLLSSNRNNTKDKIYHYKIDLPQPNNFVEINDNFCFSLSDDGNIDSTRFKHVWHTGDGTTHIGKTINHCYKDTGIFYVKCDLEDTQTGLKDTSFISADIKIDIHTPTIQATIEKNKIRLNADQRYSNINYSNYYWVVNDKIIMEKNPLVSIENKNAIVKLILWQEKDYDNAIGVLKKLTLKQ